MGVSDSEQALIEEADAWDHVLCPSTMDDIPGVSVRSFLMGGSFRAENLLNIQIMESYVELAAQSLRNLLNTLDGFGKPKFREYPR